MHSQFSPALLEQYRRLSTCPVSSAIESFGLRLPNEGFTDATVRCIFPEMPTVVGYAVTAKIKSATPPMSGGTYYYWRTDWWKQVLAVPSPRIMVLQDEDHPPGLGAFVGEVHAHILRALGCAALVTNGAVRDLPEVRCSGFQLFAGSVSVSHAYAHISSFGTPVEVGHLHVNTGDLLMGDQHGVVSIPAQIAEQVPQVAQGILDRRRHMVGVCREHSFSLEHLEAAQKEVQALELEAQAGHPAAGGRGRR